MKNKLLRNIVKVVKGFVSEININNELKEIFQQFMGNRRFVFNQLLNILKTYKKSNIKWFYDNDKKYTISSKKGLQKILTYISEDYKFLSNSHSQSNQSGSHDLRQSWKNYLDPKMKDSQEPKFKEKKKNTNTFFIPNQNNIEIKYTKDNKPYIYIKPFDKFLLKNIKDKNLLTNYNKIHIKKKIRKDIKDNKIKITGMRIKEKRGKYFISINYFYENNLNSINSHSTKLNVENNSIKIIGLDIGLKNKFISSKGDKIDSIIETKSYKDKELLQKNLKKKLSLLVEKEKKKILNKRIQFGYKSIIKKEYKKIKISRKRNKYRDKIKRDKLKFKILEKDYKFEKKQWKDIYKNLEIKQLNKKIRKIEDKLTNIRENENHHISKEIVDNNDIIFMEDLCYKGMQKLWGNKIKKLGLKRLTTMIKYKTENQGKIFYQIDRLFPSTKTCSCCGNIQKLKLSERIYKCKSCGYEIDRDINRGINIKNFGIKSYLIDNQIKDKDSNSVSEEIELIPSSETFRDINIREFKRS